MQGNVLVAVTVNETVTWNSRNLKSHWRSQHGSALGGVLHAAAIVTVTVIARACESCVLCLRLTGSAQQQHHHGR